MKKFFIVIILIISGLTTNAQRYLNQDSVRILALRNNEQVLKAQNGVQEANLDLKNAKAGYLPTIDGSAMLAWIFPKMDMMGQTLSMQPMYSLGASLTQPIYAGGRIINGNKMAQAGVECAEIQQRMTSADVVASADNSYWTLIAVTQQIKMLEAYKRQMDTLVSTVQRSVDAQMATNHDLLRIQAKQSEISYNLQKAKNGLTLVSLALKSAIGDTSAAEIVAVDTIITINPPQDLDEDISSRPEIQLLEKQIEVRKNQIKMQRAESLPTIALLAGYTYYGNIKIEGAAQGPDGNYYPYTQEMRDGLGLVALSAQIPIFSWGTRSRNVKKAQLELEDAKLDLQLNTRQISIQAQQAVQNVVDGYALVLTAELARQQSEENLRMMALRYDAQMSTLTDLLDAQSQWQQSVSNLIEAQTRYKIAETEWKKAVGRL